MRLCPIASVQPFVAMPAPVYVFLRANEKFVAVKGPLDFFTPEELEKLSPMESFFFPEFIDQLHNYREAGRRVKAILSWRAEGADAVEKDPAPYEISDAVIRIVGRLWTPMEGYGTGIESFFVTVLVSELCEPIAGVILNEIHDRDVAEYERRLIASSWMVFLALHLGYCDPTFLRVLRIAAFTSTVDETFSEEIRDLAKLVEGELAVSGFRALGSHGLEVRSERVARKLASRMGRVESALMNPDAAPLTIYGETGFVDA